MVSRKGSANSAKGMMTMMKSGTMRKISAVVRTCAAPRVPRAPFSAAPHLSRADLLVGPGEACPREGENVPVDWRFSADHKSSAGSDSRGGRATTPCLWRGPTAT